MMRRKERYWFFHMNYKNRTAIFAGTLSLVLRWLVMVVVLTFLFDKVNNIIVAGNYARDSMTLYGNAHLLEQMEEGTYHPLCDPIFIMTILAMYAPSFFAGSLVSRLVAGANNNLAAYVTVAIGALLVTVSCHRDVLHYSSRMMQAVGFEFAVMVGSLLIGLYVGKRMKKSRVMATS